MDVQQLLDRVKDSLTIERVFGAPIEKDGTTVIPVARILGGAGGGGGQSPADQATGEGGGFGIRARPVGVFVIRDQDVTWRPAVDVNRVILGAQVVAVIALLTARSITKSRASAPR
jgi:uncharacterized spore protein YtfJ